jgi:hypothetical protein
MGSHRLSCWFCLVGCVAAMACAPETRYRRTAVIPQAHPYSWNGRTARAGSLRVEGAVHATSIDTNPLPRVGDTAVFVPEVAVDGSAVLAITGGLELGLRGSYASYSWTDRSAVGTMPVPGAPSVYGFGPEVRGTFWFGKERRFGLGVGGSVLAYRISTALWEQDDGCAAPDTCVDTNDNLFQDRWRLAEEDARHPLTWNLAVYPSFAFGPEGAYGHVFGGVSVHEAYENDGFTNTTEGPPVAGAGFVWFAGAGYGISFEPVRVAALVAHPFTSIDSPVHYGSVSFFLTLGADIPLWGDR